MIAYLSKQTQHQHSLIPLMTHQRCSMMPMSTAATGSNDTAVNYMALKLVFSCKLLIQEYSTVTFCLLIFIFSAPVCHE